MRLNLLVDAVEVLRKLVQEDPKERRCVDAESPGVPAHGRPAPRGAQCDSGRGRNLNLESQDLLVAIRQAGAVFARTPVPERVAQEAAGRPPSALLDEAAMLLAEGFFLSSSIKAAAALRLLLPQVGSFDACLGGEHKSTRLPAPAWSGCHSSSSASSRSKFCDARCS